MERTTSINEAKKIFGSNFIGPEELLTISEKIGIDLPSEPPLVPFDIDLLKDKANDYLLVLGVSKFIDNSSMNIVSLQKIFGVNPDIAEPCFYNQDWYLQEKFASRELENKWFLIRKDIFNNSRALLPELLSKSYIFPSAILCSYTFFIFWLISGKVLWQDDFIWCDDVDHNGDRVYVGRYYDSAKINKNGFNIHRYLSIHNNYGCVDLM